MKGPKVVKVASALGRRLLNLGPSAACRQLYSGVCQSMTMHGASVWDRLTARNKATLRSAQSIIVLGMIRGIVRYRRLRLPLEPVLTEHDCFSDYLCRTAQREPTTGCHYYGAEVDSAQYTLEVCSRWVALRRVPTTVLGGDLSLPSVITAMLGNDESRKATVSFCETVMSQKEDDEWVSGDKWECVGGAS
ncbi:uncharacterized protein LOC123670332 [Melitaea cinxia]|uniref:uncharacterized protein LOC123670332 n=1 Tax=Melitaea cinxia TaxID=113334 RepID=UPI001E2746E2|nr:uncharacterized protein LOC123670332 [Melitaea cinxia]